jgi:hypothetical protein
MTYYLSKCLAEFEGAALINLAEIFSPIICFIVNVLMQVVMCRYKLSKGMLKTELTGFLSGLLFLFLNLIFQSYISVYILIVNLIIYTALSYCYFHFINLSVTARRIRIVRELYQYENGLTKTEILRKYNAKDMVENRINRMINSGQIITKNDRLYIGKPILLLIAKIMVLLKIIIIGRKSINGTNKQF